MVGIILWLLEAIAIVVLAICLITTFVVGSAIGLYAIGQVILGLKDKDSE